MSNVLRGAFTAAHRGFSSDRVIADVDLNKRFIDECRSRGLARDVASLNQDLLSLRKRSGLKGITTTRRTVFSDDDEYRFASEMAVRFLERRDQITLDAILCDPERAAEFDQVAAKIAPGFDSLRYRWAALRLRKSTNLSPEQFSHILPSVDVVVVRVADLNLNTLPVQEGLYVFFTRDTALYVGESGNLHRRLKKHMDHSDNKGLAQWMWKHGTEELHIEFHILPNDASTAARRALEKEMIQSRRPLFNVQ